MDKIKTKSILNFMFISLKTSPYNKNKWQKKKTEEEKTKTKL